MLSILRVVKTSRYDEGNATILGENDIKLITLSTYHNSKLHMS